MGSVQVGNVAVAAWTFGVVPVKPPVIINNISVTKNKDRASILSFVHSMEIIPFLSP